MAIIANREQAAQLGIYFARAGIWGRMFGYLIMYILLLFFIVFGNLIDYTGNTETESLTGIEFLDVVIFLLAVALPFILLELRIRHVRKKLGLPVNKNVMAEFEKMEMIEKIKKRKRSDGSCGDRC